MTPEARERLALALIWVTPALWAVNNLVARLAPGVVGAHVLAFGRWGLAGLALVLLSRSELWRQRHHVLAHAHQYLVLGVLGMLVCGAWVYLGAQTTVALNIALIYSAAPVLIAIGSVFLLGEAFVARQVWGVLLALVGVLHVIVKGQWLNLGQVQWSVGDGWIVGATVSWALYALLQKRWSSPLGATAQLAAICVGGVVALAPFALWELQQADTPPWSWRAGALIAVAALLPGVAAYWIYGWSQRVLGASRVAVSLYLAPLYVALAAWGVLGEPLGQHHGWGALLILPGVFLVTRRS